MGLRSVIFGSIVANVILRVDEETLAKAAGLTPAQVRSVLLKQDVPLSDAVRVGGLLAYPGAVGVPRG